MKTLLLFISCLMLVGNLIAKPKAPFYYLCIGSGHYEPDTITENRDSLAYTNVLAACNSALRMADFLKGLGGKGKVFVSGKKQKFTKNRFELLIADAVVELKKDGAFRDSALFVFYYCGHGVSDFESNDLFIIPGNFNYDIKTENREKIVTEVISTKNLNDLLGKRLRPIMLLDCCYNNVRDSTIDLSLLGLDITKLADGLASFLVTRTKSELNEAFFYKFYTTRGKGKLSKLFYKSIGVVDSLDNHNFNVAYRSMLERKIELALNLPPNPDHQKILNSMNGYNMVGFSSLLTEELFRTENSLLQKEAERKDYKVTDAIVFSARKGERTATCLSPSEPTLWIGPLCRRTLLFFKLKKSFTVQDWIGALTASAVDTDTQPANTPCISLHNFNFTLKPK